MKHLISLALRVSLVTVLFFYLFLFSKCSKEQPLPDYYIRCKINGEDYLPNNCANCMRGQLLGDTVFMMNANAGFQSLLIGVINKPSFILQTYILNRIQSGGSYKNSTTTNDKFDTDSIHTGTLTITTLDKSNMIIAGTFSFQAYNPVQNKTVSVSDGQFRLKYTDN
jgi:hypothetical protein